MILTVSFVTARMLVLSWEAVIETLVDDDFTQKNNMEESAISAHLVCTYE